MTTFNWRPKDKEFEVYINKNGAVFINLGNDIRANHTNHIKHQISDNCTERSERKSRINFTILVMAASLVCLPKSLEEIKQRISGNDGYKNWSPLYTLRIIRLLNRCWRVTDDARRVVVKDILILRLRELKLIEKAFIHLYCTCKFERFTPMNTPIIVRIVPPRTG